MKAHSDKNVFLVVDQFAIDESHVIAQDQLICSIYFSRNLHNFDVFRLDGLLNPQVLGSRDVSNLQGPPEQHRFACGSVHCVNQRISHTFDLAFHAERSLVPACGSSHTHTELYNSSSPLLSATTGCRLHQC